MISDGAAGAAYNTATGQTTAAGKGFAYNTRKDTGVAVGRNNVYAGKDGEVYRYNKSTGLEQRSGAGWQTVNRPTELQKIQSQQGARATGQQRWESFRAAGPMGTPSSNGGSRFNPGGGLRTNGRFRR